MAQKSDYDGTPSPTLIRGLGFVILLTILTFIGGCGSIPTRSHGPKLNINNACNILENRSDWYQSMKKSYRKWGIPIPVQLAIIHQESKFVEDARPPRKKFFWFFPGPRPSTAFGYAQALDGTWEEYKQKTKNHHASRDNFEDATDFIGWYGDISNKRLRIPKKNARAQYLAYHEGHTGYKRKTYLKKKWLVQVAKKVGKNARRYRAQMRRCKKSSGGTFIFPKRQEAS